MNAIKFQNQNFLNLYADGSYDLRLGRAGLYNCFPSIDGKSVDDAAVTIDALQDAVTVTYQKEEITLQLQFAGSESHLSIKTKLLNITGDAVEKVNIFDQAVVTNAKKILAHGYFSWDQSFMVHAEDLEDAEGNGLTAILNKDDVLFMGYLTHDKMFQTFNYKAEANQIALTSEMYLEGKDLSDISGVEFSEVVCFSDPDLDLGQKKWADLVVQANDIKLDKPITKGWCSWYYDYFWFSGEILENHLANFKPHKADLNLDVFVVDANHFAHLGDWLTPDPKFPKGMEYYAQEITKAGYVPGIWIGPWMVSDRGQVFKDHPEWMVKDMEGNLIEFMNPLGEDNIWAYRGKLHYCLDTSHPEAFEYLRQVFRTLRKWGYKYYKTDFMFWGSMDRFEGGWMHDGINAHNLIKNKAERPLIKRHTPGKTRMEYFVDVLKMIREEIGEESIWLGCGQPIWSSIGYVDSMRVSRDVGARWAAHNSPKELLNDLAYRNFTNNKFYEVDPDCILLRDWETKITETEATSLALLMGVAQGMIMTSDYVNECKQHRLDLFKFVQGDNDQLAFRPQLLGREENLIIYSGTRKDNGMGVIYFFNNGEEPVEKTYDLADLEISGSKAVEWKKESNVLDLGDGKISVSLEPHASTLFYINNEIKAGWKPETITG